jgi:hypothetical protein
MRGRKCRVTSCRMGGEPSKSVIRTWLVPESVTLLSCLSALSDHGGILDAVSLWLTDPLQPGLCIVSGNRHVGCRQLSIGRRRSNSRRLHPGN